MSRHLPTTAMIPLSLQECLLPSELGDLLDVAAAEKKPIEDVIVLALREFIATHKLDMTAARA